MISFCLSRRVSTLCPARDGFNAMIEHCKPPLRPLFLDALWDQYRDRLYRRVRIPLRKLVICLGIIVTCPLCAIAQQPAAKKSKFEVETTWPGIRFKLMRVDRILDKRLLVVVLISATPKAPATGTLIAVKQAVPPSATDEERRAGRYEDRPFSLASSILIDDQTSERFPALAPVSPPGKEYAPAQILTNLVPGRARIMTLQFKVPPTFLSEEAEQYRQKPTVSLLLTNAKAPITGIPIPPLSSEESSAPEGLIRNVPVPPPPSKNSGF